MRLAPLVTAVAVGFETLKVNPLRTVLSTLGVIIGVSALVAVLSVGDGMERSVRAQIEETTDLQAILVRPRTTEEVDGQIFPLPNPARLTVDDARQIRALEGAKAVSLSANTLTEVRNREGTTRRMALAMSEVAFRDSARMNVATGRLLTVDEAASNAPRVVLSDDLARSMRPDSNAAAMVGDSVQVGTVKAEVIGVLEPRPAPAITRVGARRRVGDYRVLAPIELVPVGSDARIAPPSITALSATVEQTAALKQRIEQMFAARDTAWGRHYQVTTNESRLEQLSRGILMFKLFLGAITGISLLVGGIGIMNVLLSSVTERTREIGIRKATGARDRDIKRQFLAESVAISAVGSGIGLAIGKPEQFGEQCNPLYWWNGSNRLLAAVGN
jgi:putative ABC transport system permease protein